MNKLNTEGFNTILTRTTPQITAFFDSIDRMLDRIEMLAKKRNHLLMGKDS